MEIINWLDSITVAEFLELYSDLITAFFVGYFTHMILAKLEQRGK